MTAGAPRLKPLRFGVDGRLVAGDAALAAAARRLLVEAGLPPPGPGDQPMELWVAEAAPGQVVACGGYEAYGAFALLRSIAVAAEARGSGRGRWIVGRLLARLEAAGYEDVWLLTETAAPFFHALGFRPVTRDLIPAAVHASRQLNGGCCASATAMGLRLAPTER